MSMKQSSTTVNARAASHQPPSTARKRPRPRPGQPKKRPTVTRSIRTTPAGWKWLKAQAAPLSVGQWAEDKAKPMNVAENRQFIKRLNINPEKFLAKFLDAQNNGRLPKDAYNATLISNLKQIIAQNGMSSSSSDSGLDIGPFSADT